MADNTSLNVMSGGDVISTDDIAGVKVQRVKVQYGTDGNATDVSTSNPMPVSASTLPLPTGASTDTVLTGGTQQTKVTDGTNIASILKSDGTAAGQNSLLTAGTFLSVNFSTAVAAAVATTDVGNYRWVSVHQSSTGASSFTQLQGSNDNINWITVPYIGAATATPVLQTSGLSANTIAYAPLNFRYFRLNVTGISAGSTSGILAFSTLPTAPSSLFVNALPTNSAGTALFTTPAALAESTANPTLTQISNFAMAHNGNNWDRQKNNWNTSTGDTGAKTTTFNGATQTNFSHQCAYITVLCGTVTGTTPTLSAQLQWSPDGGTTWLNLGPASGNVTATGNTISFFVGPTNWSQAAGSAIANLTNGATQSVLINAPLPRIWRLAYTIGGTTPSFTLTGVYINYLGV